MQAAELHLGSCCPDFVDPWREWATRLGNPAAFLHVATDDEYQELVGRKTRNMLRKAEKHFTYRRFEHNDEIPGIYNINRSMEYRQGIKMTAAYTEPVSPIVQQHQCPNGVHNRVWLGGFAANGDLAAYLQLVMFENVGILNKIIGHADHRSMGVMNGLVRDLNRYSFANHLYFVNYLTMPSKTKTLEAFKYRVGFRETKWRIA
jgi:hypothetical protein